MKVWAIWKPVLTAITKPSSAHERGLLSLSGLTCFLFALEKSCLITFLRGQIAASPTPAARGRLSPHSGCLCLEKDPLPRFRSAVLSSLVGAGAALCFIYWPAGFLPEAPAPSPFVCIPNNGANPYRLTDRCMESNLGYRGHECVFWVYWWVVMLPGA